MGQPTGLDTASMQFKFLAMLAALCSCGGSTEDGKTAQTVRGPWSRTADAVVLDAGPQNNVVLSRHPAALAELTLPATNLPPDAVQSTQFGLGKFKREGMQDGIVHWSAPLPVRVVYHGKTSSQKPPDMVLYSADGTKLEFEKFKKKGPWKADTWSYRRQRLRVFTKAGSGPPKDLSATMPTALEWEGAMDRATAGLEDQDYAIRSVPVGEVSRQGLFLPAPGTAAWNIRIPEQAVLDSTVYLLNPMIDRGQRSSGAAITIELATQSEVVSLAHFTLKGKQRSQPIQIDLAAWSNQEVQLRFISEPGTDPHWDYVFLSNPTIRTTARAARRALLVFVDTLRRDHVSAYNPTRETTPAMDALGRQGIVFEDARAVAPWTLPSARASLTGRQPERFAEGEHMGEWFAQHGWTTALVSGNMYLGGGYDMTTGWALHRSNTGRSAAEQLRRASLVIDEYADHDLALVVHLMDPHLPYAEPKSHRKLFVKEDFEGLSGLVSEDQLKKAWKKASKGPQRKALRRYAKDRYDQNIRYTDDHIGQLLERMGPEATVIIYSDHGESFWEPANKTLGHGRSLLEAELAIPFILRAPGLKPARVKAPVSLVDIVPTLNELYGLPSPTPDSPFAFDGQSLVALARGEDIEEAMGRPIAFGRTLFDDEGWGVVLNHNKWITRSGKEQLFDLKRDPREQQDLSRSRSASLTSYHAALSEGLNMPVAKLWRLAGPSPNSNTLRPKYARIRLTHPDGFASSRARQDLVGLRGKAKLGPKKVELRGTKKTWLPREVFVVPSDAAQKDPAGLKLRYRLKKQRFEATLDAAAPTDGVLLDIGPDDPKLRAQVTTAIMPLLDGTKREPQAQPDSSAMAELKALGYVE